MPAGRKPKPTHLKLLQGKAGHRKLNENEPTPEPVTARPEPPRHLSGFAVAEWDRMYGILERNRLLTEADLSAFAAYCQAYGRWQEAEDLVAKQGLMILSPNNFPMQHPALAVANKAMEQMHKFLIEFGMTPSSRSRVQVAGTGQKTSKFHKLGSGGKAGSGKRAA